MKLEVLRIEAELPAVCCNLAQVLCYRIGAMAVFVLQFIAGSCQIPNWLHPASCQDALREPDHTISEAACGASMSRSCNASHLCEPDLDLVDNFILIRALTGCNGPASLPMHQVMLMQQTLICCKGVLVWA